MKISVYLNRCFFASVLMFNRGVYSQVPILRVGLSLAKTSRNVSDTDFHNNDVLFRKGFLLGLGYSIPISEVLTFQAELTYVQKGQKTTQEWKSSTAYTDNRNYFLSYLELPILLKITQGNYGVKS